MTHTKYKKKMKYFWNKIAHRALNTMYACTYKYLQSIFIHMSVQCAQHFQNIKQLLKLINCTNIINTQKQWVDDFIITDKLRKFKRTTHP